MLRIFKALQLSKWSRGWHKGSNLFCTRSSLSGPVWFRPDKPHRKSSGYEERQSKSTWHSAFPRSQFENIPVSFLLNEYWNYGGCGEVTLAEGKEEKCSFPNNHYHLFVPTVCQHCALCRLYLITFSKTPCKICMKIPLILWETGSSEIRGKEFLQLQRFVTSKTTLCLSLKGTKLENL